MKKYALILTSFVLLVNMSFSQLFNNYCTDFESYKQMIDNQNNYLDIEFEDEPVMSFGNTLELAKYNSKIAVIKKIMYNQMFLDNPIVDTILAQFAGELIKIKKDDLNVGKSPRKYKANGKFAAIVTKARYNKKATDFLKEKIDFFLKSQSVFIINPYISELGDPATKQIYNDAKQKFLTALGASKYKLDGIKDTRLMEFAQLPEKPANYNACVNGFKYYKTGNKYLDWVTAMLNNQNRTINIDFIFSIDSITVTKTPDGMYKNVSFHILTIDAHNASIVMVMDLDQKFDINLSDFDCVKNAINTIFSQNADKVMYELIKRYSNYIRDGAEFTLLVCEDLIKDKQENLELILSQCNLFVKGSIRPGEWRERGSRIGSQYVGRTYAIDPLFLKSAMTKILKDAGLPQFNIDVVGLTYVITRKQ